MSLIINGKHPPPRLVSYIPSSMKVKASYDRMTSQQQKRVFGIREPKKYRVLDRTGANILKAFVGIDVLKDKNGGVGGNIRS